MLSFCVIKTTSDDHGLENSSITPSELNDTGPSCNVSSGSMSFSRWTNFATSVSYFSNMSLISAKKISCPCFSNFSQGRHSNRDLLVSTKVLGTMIWYCFVVASSMIPAWYPPSSSSNSANSVNKMCSSGLVLGLFFVNVWRSPIMSNVTYLENKQCYALFLLKKQFSRN